MPFGCVHIGDSSTFFTQYVSHTRKSLDEFTLHIPNWQHVNTHYTALVQLSYNTTKIHSAGSFNGSDLFIWAYTLRVILFMIICWTRVTPSIIVIIVNNCQGFIKCYFTNLSFRTFSSWIWFLTVLEDTNLPFLSFLVIVLFSCMVLKTNKSTSV